MKAKLYDFHGQMLPLTEIAAITGINLNTLLSRVRRGRPLLEAAQKVNFCQFNRRPPKYYWYKGEHRTAQTISDMTGIPARTVYQRITGNEIDEGEKIVNLHLPVKQDDKMITYNGMTKTVRGWADHLAINYSTLFSRIVYHRWPIERAMTEKVHKSHSRPKIAA